MGCGRMRYYEILILFGIAIFIGTVVLYFSLIRPQEQAQLELFNRLCGSDIGQLSQAINPKAAEECEKIRSSLFITSNISWGAAIGILLVFLGLIIAAIKQPERHLFKKGKESKFCPTCGRKM